MREKKKEGLRVREEIPRKRIYFVPDVA